MMRTAGHDFHYPDKCGCFPVPFAAKTVTFCHQVLHGKSGQLYDGMEAEGQKNIINLVRCTWAGSQRYGALVWSGDINSDYEDFRKQICAGLYIVSAQRSNVDKYA